MGIPGGNVEAQRQSSKCNDGNKVTNTASLVTRAMLGTYCPLVRLTTNLAQSINTNESKMNISIVILSLFAILIAAISIGAFVSNKIFNYLSAKKDEELKVELDKIDL